MLTLPSMRTEPAMTSQPLHIELCQLPLIWTSILSESGEFTVRGLPEGVSTKMRPLSGGDVQCWSHLRRRSEEHTSELQSRGQLVCRLLPEKKKGDESTS